MRIFLFHIFLRVMPGIRLLLFPGAKQQGSAMDSYNLLDFFNSSYIHLYVFSNPSSSETLGSHPKTFFAKEISAFLPLTPCGFHSSYCLAISFPAILATISTSSSTVPSL